MKKKMTGALLALLLAAVGTFILISYVQSAKDKAVAGEKRVEVFVVGQPIPKGTTADSIAGMLTVAKVPEKVRPEGAVTDLGTLKGLVAGADLLPGEQLLAARFVTPQAATQGDLPNDKLRVTVDLDPIRALGGKVRPGDSVAVVMSFDPFDLAVAGGPGGTPPPGAPTKTPNTTHLTVHHALVTSVQTNDAAATAPPTTVVAGQPAVAAAPEGGMLVTLAVDAPSVEQIVFAAEYGKIWLAAEPDGAPTGGTRIVTRGNVYP